MQPFSVPSALSRRHFGLAFVTGATTAVLTPSDAMAVQDVPKPSAPPQPELRTVPASETPNEIPEPIYLLGAVLRHYPDKRLDEAAIGGILRDISGDLARGKVLSNFPLKNSDEPGYVFQAWRAE